MDASSKNPDYFEDGRFASALNVSLVTFFAPKKVTRALARKLSLFLSKSIPVCGVTAT
jgi:hypothetical protein